jgi:hypothetical protein
MARPKSKDSTRITCDFSKHPALLKKRRKFEKEYPHLTTEATRQWFLMNLLPDLKIDVKKVNLTA